MPPPRGRLTEDRLLEYLLGAKPAVRMAWWDGVELVVPAGGRSPFFHAAAPGLRALPPRLADPELAQEILNAIAAPSGATDSVRVVPVGGEDLQLKNPEVAGGVLPIDGRGVPRLPAAMLSSTELFDLRLAYRRLFGPEPTHAEPPWRPRLKAALTTVQNLAAQAEVQLMGALDLHIGRDSTEARAVAVHAVLARPPSTAPSTRRFRATTFGFGTLSDPLPRGRRAGGKTTAGAFVDCCGHLGIKSPIDIAAIAALEHAAVDPGAQQPSLLQDREGARSYWAKRKSDRQRR